MGLNERRKIDELRETSLPKRTGGPWGSLSGCRRSDPEGTPTGHCAYGGGP